MRRARFNLSVTLPLVCLILSAFPLGASAHSVNVPETRNPHLRSIARLYEKLDYEAAIALLPKAEKHPGNGEQELLWLELMKGVLYYSTKKPAESDAAFLRALQQSPFTSLPLLNPSQTLYERFEALRRHSAPAPAPVALGAPQAPAPATPSKEISAPTPLPQQEKPVDEVQAKLREVEEQALKWAAGPLPPSLDTTLQKLREQAQQARTPEERKGIIVSINAWLLLLRVTKTKHHTARDAHTPSAPNAEADPQASPQPPPAATPEQPGLDKRPSPLATDFSHEALSERMSRMREFLLSRPRDQNSDAVQEFLAQLKNLQGPLSENPPVDARRRIASDVAALEGRMAAQLGWQPQASSNPVEASSVP